MAKQPSIREFPHDDEVWKIDWLGEVEQTGHEPKIDVHLSHIPYSDAPAASGTPNTRVIPIRIGQLPYLCTGSRWRNGRREIFYSRDFPSSRLRDIRFDENTIRRIPLHHVIGERIGQGGKPRNLWLVPPYVWTRPSRQPPVFSNEV